VTVHLVGAGPGDPGLITRRGEDLLGRADLVVYDRLVDPRLLDLVPPTAELVDVGKRPGGPGDQEGINRLLVERGRAGATVVRLKGGDPFVFGRGGEEAMALAAASVPFEVVPGVSSAVAVPAYAGVPVTHRGLSACFTVVTGHSRQDPDPEPDWEALARLGGTIVVLMGVAHRAEIAARLMRAGLDAATPVLAVSWGTRPDQTSLRTTLDALGSVEMGTPSTLVIGAVAGLGLEWFESRPLFGARVVLARSPERAAAMHSSLTEAGARVDEVALTATVPASDGGEALALVAAGLSGFDWVVFSSVNAVVHLFAHLHDARSLGANRVAAVGPATAAALARRGVEADVVAPTASADGLADALPPPEGMPLLLPRSEQADRALPEALAGRGWMVVEAPAYRTVPLEPHRLDDRAREALEGADVVVLAAGSAARAYRRLEGPPAPGLVCIGPSTAAAARAEGLTVAAVAAEPTPEGVVEAVVEALGRTRS
jgi:uroporphyrinogen III methyltransferase/synthase